jgi:translation initiation factor IF-2
LQKSGRTESKTSTEKPVLKEKVQEKVVVDKKEVKAVIETKEPVSRREKSVVWKKKAQKREETLQRKRLLLSIKIVGNLTGQTIDLSQFNKPKKRKEEPKITLYKPGAVGAAGAANKNKRRIALNRVQ